MVVGDRERGLGTVGVTGDRDTRRIDLPVEHSARSSVQAQQSRDDEAHVPRLVDEIGLVGPAGRVRLLEREDGRRDDVAGRAPTPQQPAVGRRREREPVREHDQRIRSARRRIADDGLERPRDMPPIRQGIVRERSTNVKSRTWNSGRSDDAAETSGSAALSANAQRTTRQATGKGGNERNELVSVTRTP